MTVDPRRAFARPNLITNSGYAHPAIAAIKALARGDARDDQQKTAIDFIINELSRTNDEPYRPDELGGQRDTDFACGRAFVGREIRRIITQSVEQLTGRPEASKENP